MSDLFVDDEEDDDMNEVIEVVDSEEQQPSDEDANVSQEENKLKQIEEEKQ